MRPPNTRRRETVRKAKEENMRQNSVKFRVNAGKPRSLELSNPCFVFECSLNGCCSCSLVTTHTTRGRKKKTRINKENRDEDTMAREIPCFTLGMFVSLSARGGNVGGFVVVFFSDTLLSALVRAARR